MATALGDDLHGDPVLTRLRDEVNLEGQLDGGADRPFLDLGGIGEAAADVLGPVAGQEVRADKGPKPRRNFRPPLPFGERGQG